MKNQKSPHRRGGNRIAALALMTALLLAGCGAREVEEPYSGAGTELEVHCFNAGSADAFLLTTAGSAVLIDAGLKGFGKDILAYLEEKGIARLDTLLITHFDKDHVGGAAKVINSIPVGQVLQSNQPKDSDEYEKYVKALDNAGLKALTVTETHEFILDGVHYSVNPPRQKSYAADSSNNSSLIVSVQNGSNRLLFTGDAQTDRLEEFLLSDPGTYDVLKVPHHGRDEPLLERLVQTVSPTYAVIPSSDEEPESAETVRVLEEAGAQVFLTRQGSVTIRCNGSAVYAAYDE